MFDPTIQANVNDKKQAQTQVQNNKKSNDKVKVWDPAAKQLHTAINLLVVCWDIIPGKPLLDIKEKLEKYYNKPPFLSQIKSINTIISRDARKRIMINDLRRSGNNVKSFQFDTISKILTNEGEKSYFGD